MIDFIKTNFKLDKIIKKDDVESIIGLQEVREGYGINKEGNVIAFLTLNGFDLDLSSETEEENIMKKHLDFFDTRMNNPIAYNITNRKSDLSTHNKVYENLLSKSKSISKDSRSKLSMMAEVNNHLYSQKLNIPERTYVVTISYKMNIKQEQSLILKKLNSFTYFSQEQWNRIKNVLDESVSNYIGYMNQGTNLGFRMMTEDEIYLYFKNVYGVGHSKILNEDIKFLV